MTATTFPYRGRLQMLLILIVASAGLTLGCNPQTLNFILMPFVDDKDAPECKIASEDKKKEVTVALVTSFGSLETRPEMLAVDAELGERVAAVIRKRAVINKEKIAFVPASKVRTLMNQSAASTLSPQEIGEKLKANYVINLEINNITLYEKGSFNQLFRGKTEIAVACVDVGKPRGEGTIFQKIYTREYPGARGPIDAGNSSLLEFRTKFLDMIAYDIARYFVAFPSEDMRRMD
jgi:hypothetical protein